ncbi:MAG: hypothetical protein JSV24_06955 [Bacteroidales bacterium]|nr:MAG: hypothetical protein JSV24_06955 [Bacteroidales bacterium]
MKKKLKLFEILLVFCLSGLVFTCRAAQSYGAGRSNALEDNQRLIKLHYENSSGEKGITIYHYDANGIAQMATWKLLDGNRYSSNYHTFDHSGNLTGKYREFSDGLISNTIYEFDANQKLVRETYERSDDVSGETIYRYDSDGLLTEADCKGLNGWFYGLIKYEYANGRKEGAAILREGEKIGKITYGYLNNGYLLTETWEFQNGWKQHFVYEYEDFDLKVPPSYSSSNVYMINTAEFMVIKEDYNYNGETGGPSFYKYDNSGCLLEKVFERSDSFRTVTTYEYAENGLLESSIREYSNGLTADFSYEFDGNRRLTSRSFKRSDGVSGGEKYAYNEKGWLVKGTYDNFDSWLTGTLTFDHDKNGLLTSARFLGDNDYEAEITYEHDNYGNIIRIHWEFSFGKTQTYDYEYEKIDLPE